MTVPRFFEYLWRSLPQIFPVLLTSAGELANTALDKVQSHQTKESPHFRRKKTTVCCHFFRKEHFFSVQNRLFSFNFCSVFFLQIFEDLNQLLREDSSKKSSNLCEFQTFIYFLNSSFKYVFSFCLYTKISTNTKRCPLVKFIASNARTS